MVTNLSTDIGRIASDRRPEATEPISHEQFWDWIDEDLRAEWVQGKVLIQMTPLPPHQRVVRFIEEIVGWFVRQHGLGVALHEIRVRLPGFNRVPDVVFVSGLTEETLPDEYIDWPVDLAVEVVSLDSIERDHVEKKVLYEAIGVPEYWLADLIENRPLFYQADDTGRYQRVMPDADGYYESRVIPGLRFPADWLIHPIPEPAALESLGLATTGERYRDVLDRLYEAHEQAQRERRRAELAGLRADQAEEQAEQARTHAKQETTRANQERERAERADARAEQERERAEQERTQAEQARERAELERVQANQERARAEQERVRAEQERERAERLAAILRAQGIDPDAL